ncbi:hypothetical protein NKG94_14500 [Micromonospora sp. M12]
MLLLSLVVVVLGGLGSMAGTLLAALAIGEIQTLGVALLPSAAPFLLFAAMAAVLAVRARAWPAGGGRHEGRGDPVASPCRRGSGPGRPGGGALGGRRLHHGDPRPDAGAGPGRGERGAADRRRRRAHPRPDRALRGGRLRLRRGRQPNLGRGRRAARRRGGRRCAAGRAHRAARRPRPGCDRPDDHAGHRRTRRHRPRPVAIGDRWHGRVGRHRRRPPVLGLRPWPTTRHVTCTRLSWWPRWSSRCCCCCGPGPGCCCGRAGTTRRGCAPAVTGCRCTCPARTSPPGDRRCRRFAPGRRPAVHLPADFGFDTSALLLLGVVIGGTASVGGALVGAALVIAVRDWLFGVLPGHAPLVLGALFVATVYLLPTGVDRARSWLRPPVAAPRPPDAPAARDQATVAELHR